MKQRRSSGCGCGCLLFCLAFLLVAGVAIPKLTVRDPAPVSADLRTCASAAVARDYDKPYERVALMLGASRVVASSTSVAEIEPFTLFRVPLSFLRGRLPSKTYIACDAPEVAAPAAQGCDVGALCLQESRAGGGLFGVAQAQAYLIGKKTFNDPARPKEKEACDVMRITSTNDQRVITELGSSDFVVSDEAAKRFDAFTDPKAPASLLIYLKERTGRDTDPCAQRVRILN